MNYYPTNNAVCKAIIVLVMILAFPATAGVVQYGGDQQQDFTLYGPTSSKDTLWKIAKEIRTDDSVSVYQAMAAIYISNRNSFPTDNYNDLREGSTLKIPSTKVMGLVSKTLAKKKALDDNRVWIKAHREPKAKLKSTPKPRIKLLASGVRTIEGKDNPASTSKPNTAQDRNLSKTQGKADSTTSKTDNLEQQNIKTAVLEKDSSSVDVDNNSSVDVDNNSSVDVDNSPHFDNKPVASASKVTKKMDKPLLASLLATLDKMLTSLSTSVNRYDWQWLTTQRYYVGFGAIILMLLILLQYRRKRRVNDSNIGTVKLLSSPEQFLATNKNLEKVIIGDSLQHAHSKPFDNDENLQTAAKNKSSVLKDYSMTSEVKYIQPESEEQLAEKEQATEVSLSAVAEDSVVVKDSNEADIEYEKPLTEKISTHFDDENLQAANQNKNAESAAFSVDFESEANSTLPEPEGQITDKEPVTEVSPSAVAEDNSLEQLDTTSIKSAMATNHSNLDDEHIRTDGFVDIERLMSGIDDTPVENESTNKQYKEPAATISDNLDTVATNVVAEGSVVVKDNNKDDIEYEKPLTEKISTHFDDENLQAANQNKSAESAAFSVDFESEANSILPESEGQLTDKEPVTEVLSSAEDNSLEQFDATSIKSPTVTNKNSLNEFMRTDGFVDIERLMSGIDDIPAKNESYKEPATVSDHLVAEDNNEADIGHNKPLTATISTRLDDENLQAANQNKSAESAAFSVDFESEANSILPESEGQLTDKEPVTEVLSSAEDNSLEQFDTTSIKSAMATNQNNLNEFMRLGGFVNIERLMNEINDTPAKKESTNKQHEEPATVSDHLVAEDNNEADIGHDKPLTETISTRLDDENLQAAAKNKSTEPATFSVDFKSKASSIFPESEEQLTDKEPVTELSPSAVAEDNSLEPLDTTSIKPPMAVSHNNLNEFMRTSGFVNIERLMSEIDDKPVKKESTNKQHEEPATVSDNLDGVVADVVAVDVDYNENIVNAKLDLARAYIETDDKENAKDLLKDVIINGNAYQQQEAMRLLERS